MESVTEQVRVSVRAYPLFILAKMFLDKPERCLVRFRSRRLHDAPQLIQCSLCGNLFMDENRLTVHSLQKHRTLYYQEERVQTDPPKGNFAAVAQCKLNGALLGPSNHHAYQSNLMQLYKASFQHLSFDRFKESIVSVRDPEIVKKWQEQASWKTTSKCLQDPEAQPLVSDVEVERHFRLKHLPTLIRRETQFILEGERGRQLDDPRLASMVRQVRDEEARFPMNVANRLRDHFLKAGLHIFKGKKGMQFVSAVRPKPLTAKEADLSNSIRVILDYIRAHAGQDRKTVTAALAPAPAPSRPAPEVAPATPAATPSVIKENTESGKDEVSIAEGREEGSRDASPSPVPAAPPTGPAPATASAALLQDLLWLTHQGHVIEYNNGILEVVRSAPPKKQTPSKPSPKASATPAAPVSADIVAPVSPPPALESSQPDSPPPAQPDKESDAAATSA